jgi:hypothetical protein
MQPLLAIHHLCDSEKVVLAFFEAQAIAVGQYTFKSVLTICQPIERSPKQHTMRTLRGTVKQVYLVFSGTLGFSKR